MWSGVNGSSWTEWPVIGVVGGGRACLTSTGGPTGRSILGITRSCLWWRLEREVLIVNGSDPAMRIRTVNLRDNYLVLGVGSLSLFNG